MKLKSVVIVPPNFFGGEGDGSIDSVVNSDSFLSGDTEVQSDDDQDWNNTGNQDQSESSESEQSGDADEGQDGDEEEETDSSEESEENQDEKSEDGKFEPPKEIAKSYPKNVMAHFAKRLGATLEDLEANQPLQKAVKQLVDNAIHDEQQKARLSELEADDEEEQEEEETEEKPVTEKKTPEQELTEYRSNLKQMAQRFNDPQIVKAMTAELFKDVWGLDINDPKTAEQLKKKGVNPDRYMEILTEGSINLMNTAAPHFMSQWVEAAFPGFVKMYEGALHQQITEQVRNSKEFADKGLPEYGTPEFNQKIGEVLKANPWIDRMRFTDKNGRPVEQSEQITQKYRVAFQLMSGKKPDAAVVEKALETGRREERKKAVKTKTATNLAPGKTGGNFGKSDSKLKGSGGGFVEEYQKRKGDGF